MSEYIIEVEYDTFNGTFTQKRHEEIVRCRDCKHGHITIDGRSCKWCDLIATHDIDGDEPNNGYDPEPYFDTDFFCAWGERRDA